MNDLGRSSKSSTELASPFSNEKGGDAQPKTSKLIPVSEVFG